MHPQKFERNSQLQVGCGCRPPQTAVINKFHTAVFKIARTVQTVISISWSVQYRCRDIHLPSHTAVRKGFKRAFTPLMCTHSHTFKSNLALDVQMTAKALVSMPTVMLQACMDKCLTRKSGITAVSLVIQQSFENCPVDPKGSVKMRPVKGCRPPLKWSRMTIKTSKCHQTIKKKR